MKSLKLPADIRIQSASALHERLSVALDGAGRLRLHCAEVTRLDTAGLQLLVAAAAEARRRGRELQLVAPSQVLRDGLQRLGLETHFSFPATKARSTRVQKVQANG